MKTDNGALKPEVFNLNKFIETEEPTSDFSAEEEVLAAGADKGFWKALKGHFESSIQQLEQINEQAIAGGAPFDEIGRNALVISQVKGIIRKIVNVVEDAKAAQDGKQK